MRAKEEGLVIFLGAIEIVLLLDLLVKYSDKRNEDGEKPMYISLEAVAVKKNGDQISNTHKIVWPNFKVH